MYYGHGSWIAVVIFGGMFVARFLTSQRRGGRGGRPRPVPGSSFTDPDPRSRSGVPPVEPPTGVGAKAAGTAPGWFQDPFFKHGFRYWSGDGWTEHVSDDGVPGIDPPPERTGRTGDT